jgi:acetylglutamate kinase
MKRFLIKLGGSSLVEPDTLKNFAKAVKDLTQKSQVIIVHGGGPFINKALTAANTNWQFIDGQRVTDEQSMQIVEMVLSGQVNKSIVRSFNVEGISSIGIAGTDNQIIECEPLDERLGQVGKVTNINPETIEKLIDAGFTPVISPVGLDGNAKTFNINADWAAAEIAMATNADHLIYLSDIDGVLDKSNNLIATITQQEIDELISDETLTGGMVVKAQTIKKSLNSIPEISLINGKLPHRIFDILSVNNGIGTTFTRSKGFKTAKRSFIHRSFNAID